MTFQKISDIGGKSETEGNASLPQRDGRLWHRQRRFYKAALVYSDGHKAYTCGKMSRGSQASGFSLPIPCCGFSTENPGGINMSKRSNEPVYEHLVTRPMCRVQADRLRVCRRRICSQLSKRWMMKRTLLKQKLDWLNKSWLSRQPGFMKQFFECRGWID